LVNKKLTLLLLSQNTGLFTYLAWQKHAAGGCPACHKVPFLPVSDVTVALVGATVSLILAFLILLSACRENLRYAVLVLAGSASAFGFFLLAGQIVLGWGICYPCLATTILFYLVFGILVYQTVITPLLRSTGTRIKFHNSSQT
jgi:hypothetical protein